MRRPLGRNLYSYKIWEFREIRNIEQSFNIYFDFESLK